MLTVYGFTIIEYVTCVSYSKDLYKQYQQHGKFETPLGKDVFLHSLWLKTVLKKDTFPSEFPTK